MPENFNPSQLLDEEPRQEISLPQYDLSEIEIDVLTRKLTSEFPASRDSIFNKYSCYTMNGTNQFSNLARNVEATVFQEEFNNSPSDMHDGYGDFEGASNFFLVIDQEKGRPVGALRYITNSPAGLKTLNDVVSSFGIPLERIKRSQGIDNLDDCWDAGTVAVLKAYREGNYDDAMVSTSLYRALYDTAIKAKVKHVVSIIDERAYKQLTQTLVVPFVPITGTNYFNYMGSERSMPAYCNVDELYERHKANKNKLSPTCLRHFGKYIDRLMLGTEVPPVTTLD